MAEVNVIQRACKMLLGLQDFQANSQEPRGDRLYFLNRVSCSCGTLLHGFQPAMTEM
jgi:hypothetical protein